MGQVYSQAACQYAYQGDMDGLSGVLSAQPAVINLQDDITGDTPLIAACRHSNLSTVRFLLDKGADPGLRNKLQKQRRNEALMKEVLSTSVDVNALDYKGNTALHYVCVTGRQSLVASLLLRDAQPQVKNHEGETPLDIAIRLKFTRLVPMLRKMQ
ncbi:ankyrin repeat domain-containing protein 22 isoform X3 [Nerophis lumbriciformis]|uniref:ankyrin repeat domain-containing protein 22 isoform X3 n=1 Tax=Nerophis lumbriciformis TaxID=546530 RepID=UPI002ADF8806|nr:ankyrin repeat domain-containing protein 22-like isoform X3 [Nerophis lumbriciformis]